MDPMQTDSCIVDNKVPKGQEEALKQLGARDNLADHVASIAVSIIKINNFRMIFDPFATDALCR